MAHHPAWAHAELVMALRSNLRMVDAGLATQVPAAHYYSSAADFEDYSLYRTLPGLGMDKGTYTQLRVLIVLCGSQHRAQRDAQDADRVRLVSQSLER